jgi:hypothetical protein
MPLLSAEGWLLLMLGSLYVQDAVLALRPQEAVLECTLRGRWRARFGSQHWKLRGREIALPGLLTPHRPLFRLGWRMDGASRAEPPAGTDGTTVSADPLVAAAASVAFLASHVWVTWLALFVMLPLGLFGQAGGLALVVAALVLFYANNLVALWRVYQQRARWALSARAVGKLAVECLTCPPYALNLVRRLCALATPQDDFVQAAGRLLAPDDLAWSRAQCLLRIDEEIEAEPLGSARMAALETARRQFQPEQDPSSP